MILSIVADGFLQNSGIFLIGTKGLTTVRLWKKWEFESESDMIYDFIKHFIHIDDKILIGYNILKFDLMMLMLRAKNLAGFDQFFRKINMSNIVDLYVILTFLNKGTIKNFSHYCKKYGVNGAVSDFEIIRAYQNNDHINAEKYFISKLNATNELFLKMWGRIKEGKSVY